MFKIPTIVFKNYKLQHDYVTIKGSFVQTVKKIRWGCLGNHYCATRLKQYRVTDGFFELTDLVQWIWTSLRQIKTDNYPPASVAPTRHYKDSQNRWADFKIQATSMLSGTAWIWLGCTRVLHCPRRELPPATWAVFDRKVV